MESSRSNTGSISGIMLEKQLQQKLFLLENGVARIAHTRNQLKDNADLVGGPRPFLLGPCAPRSVRSKNTCPLVRVQFLRVHN